MFFPIIEGFPMGCKNHQMLPTSLALMTIAGKGDTPSIGRRNEIHLVFSGLPVVEHSAKERP